MARRRSDFDKSLPGRLLKWIREGSGALDEDVASDLSAPPEGTEDERARETRLEAMREENIAREAEKEKEVYLRLHEWAGTRGARLSNAAYKALSLLLCGAIVWGLLSILPGMPPFGSADNPANNIVSRRYLTRGAAETGAVNLVSGMILDYRAFDTLGESNVLFLAACAVLILLRTGDDEEEKRLSESDDRAFEPKDDVILRAAAAVIVPICALLGIYILLNGHLSPGGGFSGGTVLGAGLILYLNAFGFKKTERFFTLKTFKLTTALALCFYALSKTWVFFAGANGLKTGVSLGELGSVFSSGLILPLNIAVGLTVGCTMYAFYALFRKGDF